MTETMTETLVMTDPTDPTDPPPLTDPVQDTRAALVAWSAWMNEFYLEREDMIHALQLGVLTREHVIAQGPPGTGKSAIAADMRALFPTAEIFHSQLHPMTMPEDVIGGIDVPAFDATGAWQRIIDGYLPTADLAILEEIDKAGPAVLTQLLTMLNERRYKHGSSLIVIPLQTAVGNCNAALDDETGAVWDRWLLRVYVDQIQDGSNFLSFLSNATATREGFTGGVSLADLAAAQAAVETVGIHDDVYPAVAGLQMALRQAGVELSVRRWGKALAVMQANAWLEGRTAVTVDDITVLQHVLWLTPDSRVTVRDLVEEVASPNFGKVQEFKTITDEIRGQLLTEPWGTTAERLTFCQDSQLNLRATFREVKKFAGASGKTGGLAASITAEIPKLMSSVIIKSGVVRTQAAADAETVAMLGIADA